jgi:predicted porin
MQKKFLGLAIAAAFAAPVTAMADAALYGTFDVGLRQKSALGANSSANTTGTSGTSTSSMDMRGLYASNAWGFKNSEDLGDGMKANLVFEADFIPGATDVAGNWTYNAANTTQGQLFDRQLTGEIAGSFGTATVGYQYTTAFKSNRTYDPMGYAFVTSLYSSAAVTSARGYSAEYSNKFGDISVAAQYIMNNQDTASNSPASTGQGRSVGVDYAAGPISVGGSYTTVDSDVRTGTNKENPTTNVTAGAGFNFGDGTAKIGYAKKTTGAGSLAAGQLTNDATSTTMWVGANYNVSSKIGAALAYYKNTANAGNAGGGTAAAVDVVKTKLMGMVTYAMSKKTTAYLGAETESADVASTTTNSVGTTGAIAGTTLAADKAVTSSWSVGVAFKF